MFVVSHASGCRIFAIECRRKADPDESFRRLQWLAGLVCAPMLSHKASRVIREAPAEIIAGLFDRNHPDGRIPEFMRVRIKVFPERADSKDETVVKR
ncbi:hypothetical protein [Burkholderia latens]|uniref:hypothetical protein n=1 Tax=Burkholderia latens TaxID=488446 RepID=UPI000A819A78|nr:hypothetical protein [Burkholderia latens]QTO45336.1 hypothetical protein J8I85_23120 [Burkholderia latens]